MRTRLAGKSPDWRAKLLSDLHFLEGVSKDKNLPGRLRMTAIRLCADIRNKLRGTKP